MKNFLLKRGESPPKGSNRFHLITYFSILLPFNSDPESEDIIIQLLELNLLLTCLLMSIAPFMYGEIIISLESMIVYFLRKMM